MTDSGGAIAIVSLVDDGFGGLEHHVINLARQLESIGRPAILVVPRSSRLHERALTHKLRCHPVTWVRWVRGQPVRTFLLSHTLIDLGRRCEIAAIHCNNRFEVSGTLRAARVLDCTSVMNYHVPAKFDARSLAGMSAVAAPNAEVIDFIARENQQMNLGIGAIRHIPPILDSARLLSFCDQRPRKEWFRAVLDIHLRDGPVICMIGNMVPDLLHKNYPLLFRALRRLKDVHQLPVQAVLVGDGPARPHLEGLRGELGLTQDVHFLGYRSAEVPGIISMSDFCVLASSHEAFGMVLVEAALMRKAAIAARGTGAEQIIVHRETGLLFENGSVSSLAEAIAVLVRQPALASGLGSRAHARAAARFVPEVVIEEYLNLYARKPARERDTGAAAAVFSTQVHVDDA
jgi:glycosyltransferase involved in cell wall biosynthesis